MISLPRSPLRHAHLLILSWALSTGPESAVAQEAPAIPSESLTAVEFFQRVGVVGELLREFVDSSAVPGVSIALGAGDFTWFEAFGYADLDRRVPAAPTTRFRIGSVSKALTADALGLLVEEGVLDLSAPIQEYVPEFPEKVSPITSRHLAHHLSGIRHYRGDEAYSNQNFEGVMDALPVFADDPLLAEPGTRFSYSTYGYTLLSAAMECAADEPFLSLMRSRVLDPLGMSRTGPELKDRRVPEQATGYELGRGGDPVIPPEVDLSNKWAGGGYVSTAGDLLKFARSHLSGALLKPETLDLLWTSLVTPDGTDTHQGIGWQIVTDPGGRRMLVAGGSAIGGTAVMFVFPEEEVVMVFLCNMGNAPIRGVPTPVARVLLGDESE